jgi:hypothetical protein
MASRASTLGKGWVLDPSFPPAPDLIVAGGTQLLGRFHEETSVRTAMGLVACHAFALGHRRVDDRLVFPSRNLTVAAGTQRTGALTQQGAVAGHMRVMTGSALPVLDWCVLDPGAKGVVQIVAAETDLLLIDLLSGR